MKTIKIKKLSYLSIILFVLFSSSSIAAQKIFELNGIAKGKDGQKVELVRYTTGGMDHLATDTIHNGKFHISCPVDEVGPAVVQIDRNFGGTVILANEKVEFILNENGSYQLQGGKYNQVMLGYLRSKEFMATENLFRKLTKGGNVEAIKGTKDEWKMIQPFLRKEELRSLYLDSIMKANPDPLVKVMAAVMDELQPDPEKAMEAVNKAAIKLGENNSLVNRARAMDKRQKEALARRHAGMLGEQYTDFVASTLKGEKVHLATIVKAHKYTLLQFWASWCGPCRKEIPLLRKLYAKYKSDGFEIVSFSLDDNKYNWEKVSEIEKLSWYNLSDLLAFKSGIVKNYPIDGIPANVIIDNEGKIIASNLTGDDLEKKISTLFQ